ncbi:hypothetical protein NHX12_028613 [Muraenolepis orangiensis]|uniref:PH domain-containing protein n=1 Tax=Muraenolepis orangiensis TaxID=630683 RepID=A0A9Q0EG81_9TELE|nr:hypothetical protein NHX12_028613 [Muraenolepis orangiensis]
MDRILSRLIRDLQSFLCVLDTESLSYIAQAQKKSLSELLAKLQTADNPVEDAEYMFMSCPSSSLPSNKVTDTLLTEKAETESSHYELYGEEGEEPVTDRAHYIKWSASQPCLRSAPSESRLCGYLWRKRWLGQWSKQLFVIRDDALLCYRSAKDLLPQLEMGLQGCQVQYRPQTSKGHRHELRVSDATQTLVLGLTDPQQAAEWKRVMEDVNNENSNKGFLNVLMNFQWQSLLCQVEAGLLKMFGEEEEQRGEGDRPPQYTVQLRGAEVVPGPDTDHSFRISLSLHGLQTAVLEAGCLGEKKRWLQLLREQADHRHPPGRGSNDAADSTGAPLSGLQTRRFPTSSNMYMDDLFHLKGAVHDQPLYSNTSMLQNTDGMQECLLLGDMVTYSNTGFTSHNRVLETKRGVQKLELTGSWRVGSELNLASAGKQNKRTSFRQSLAICSERAQTGFLGPLLRRTASAKTSLTRVPSALFLQQGKVCQRRQEWERKAAA